MHIHQEMEGYYLGVPSEQSAAVAAVRAVARPKRSGRRTSIQTKPAPPKSVMLILEDFDEIRAFLARHFTEQGYEVYSSSMLRDALAIAWEETPQVILIDHDLAGETPIHAIKRLHDAQPQSYVVLIGGPQTADAEEEAILAGASKVLPESYGITDVDNIVDALAHRAALQRPCMRTS